MDQIIQIATNVIPLRAVFSTGAITPVIGLALIQGELDSMPVNMPGGIAVFKEGLVVCEQVECFLGYAEPAKFDAEGNLADDDEAKLMYDNWAGQQQSNRDGDGTEED